MKIIVLAAALLAQAAEKKPHPGVDQTRVTNALHRGASWLLGQEHPKEYAINGHKTRSHELVLYTLLHAGADRTSGKFQAMLKEVLSTPLERTYNVSLQAMLLQELDAETYQWRIAQCCQFLVDNQCRNGQWSYGEPTELSNDVATPARRAVASGSSGGVVNFGSRATVVESKKPRRSVRIRQKRTGPATGDNSNTQYASLGLRACLEANVNPPNSVLVRAVTWWEKTQGQDGGWSYHEGGKPWGSMTAGAVAAVIIYRHHLHKNWRRAPSVNKGVAWLADKFTVKKNPNNPGKDHWTYYYLYALERTGILADTDKIGPHDWYLVGANHLLDTQQGDGSWKPVKKRYDPQEVWDTCFAILFLARATRPMVASTDR